MWKRIPGNQTIECKICQQKIDKTCPTKMYCINCLKEKKKEWSKNWAHKNRQTIKPLISLYNIICEGCQLEFPATHKNRRFCEQCRYDRGRHTTDKFNLKRSLARSSVIQNSQNKCNICGDTKEDNLLVIDHDHNCCPPARACSNCIRGVLCKSCNTGLGSFKDKQFLLSRSIDYLRRFEMKSGIS